MLMALLPTLALAGVGHHVKDDHWSSEYDALFRKYTKHYFGPHFDWHWFKAQGIAESGLDADALSPAGARGIMQILPATYDEIRERNRFMADIEDPRWNIAAGIFYDRQLYRKWKKKSDIHTSERLNFAFASYNAGYGNILKAHRRAQARKQVVKRWDQVEAHAPSETRHYVRRIQRLMQAVE
ncbi:MAG: transglycosylase SLT domain-containing protein [Gammaproteobacteria bacterium]|nr:transglycosylase SLT domain-containing protein [Gammaproteobacteria bacterium]